MKPSMVNPLLYTAYFLLGFALLSLEVIWGRMTALPLGSSIHAYSITLAAVMAGLFCGTWHGNQVSTDARPSYLFAFLLLFSLAAGLTSIGFVYLSEIFEFWRFLDTLSVKAAYFATLGQASLMVFIPSMFCGAVFPIATQLLVPDVKHAGRTAGTLYMMNSLGAIAGCLLTGFVLIEQLGLRQSAILCAALPALPGLIFFLMSRSLAGSLSAVLILGVVGTGGSLAQFSYKPFSLYLSRVSETRTDFEQRMSRVALIDETEGIHGITRVLTDGRHRFLQVNNKNESSFMGEDLPTQALAALLPRVYLGRNPERFLDIGLGTGTTLWVAHRWAGHIDSVEINPDVQAMFTRHFFPELADSPQVTFLTTEARFHLSGTDQRYDIIAMEPSYPNDGVTASLYTRESFAALRRALNEQGVLSLFIPYHVLGPVFSGGIIKTLLTQFSNVHVWDVSGGLDIVVVAANVPFTKRPDDVLEQISTFRFEGHGDLSSRLAFSAANAMIDQFVQSDEYPVYTDDSITLELAAMNGFLE